MSVFTSSVMFAQITITSADMPNAGDSIRVSVTNSIGGVDPTLSDTNYFWDFSALTPNVQQFEKFDSPTTFTSPFNLLFNPFNTSYGKNNYGFTTIPLPGGVSITAAYDFLKESSTALKQIGAGYTVNGAPIPFLYSSVDVIYKFPMHYSNTDSCDYKYGLQIPSMGYYGETGHRVNLVDGWGTLKTPYGSFQTLRVKSAIKAIDTIYVTNFGIGTNVNRPLKYEFKWLAIGKEIPVLEIDANVVGSNLTITNVQYIDSVRAVPQVGIAENPNDKFNLIVYPNPCIDNVWAQYNLFRSSEIKISILDMLGKTIATISDETQTAGTHQKLIKMTDLGLSAGVYFLKIKANDFQKIQKIIVSK